MLADTPVGHPTPVPSAIRVSIPGWIYLRFSDGSESKHGRYGFSYADALLRRDWPVEALVALQTATSQLDEWIAVPNRLREIAKICAGAARLHEMGNRIVKGGIAKQERGKTDLVGFEESPMWEWLTGQVFSEEEWPIVHRMMYEEYHKLPF